jgi:peroxiredoxin
MKNSELSINDQMPVFADLLSTDGKKYSSADLSDKKLLVVVFSCNHCPYVIAYEDRMIALQRDYASKGVQLIAINSNDEQNYPEDNFDRMVERAQKKQFNFPYLRDKDQTVATAYGATHTPQFFIFDAERSLQYSGKMDDNWEHPADVKERYLRDALDALLSGQPMKKPKTFSIGCTIKWSA